MGAEEESVARFNSALSMFFIWFVLLFCCVCLDFVEIYYRKIFISP